MNKKTVIRALLSPLFGCISAMLFLLLAAALLSSADEPDKLTTAAGVAAIFIGALVCGLFSKITKNGAPAAFISGAAYALPLLVLSVILGGGDIMPLGLRALIFAAAALLAGTVAVIPSRKKAGRGIGDQRNAVNKYIARRQSQ